MDKNTSPSSIYYFSSTHWDREWYHTFQGFRSRLVDIIDEVLDTLEKDDSFTQFISDGQTILWEDYLAIQGKNRERLTALLNDRRIIVGPWYTMPDENLVSGESLIRNLLIGHDTAASLSPDAPILPLGYVCDCFGHVAQLPQILNGFHIPNVLLGRGTNQETCPSFFRWESPDKSQCTAYKVPESTGYGSFFFDVFYACAAEGKTDLESLFSKAVEYVENERRRSPLPYILLIDGMDHTAIHPEAPKLLELLKKHYACDGHLGNIDELFNNIRTAAKENEELLPVKKGELEEPAKDVTEEHNKLISGTLSSRYDLKLENDTAQTLLEKESLPLAALSSISGYEVPPAYADTAYRYLIKNHAHDSICGCSVDEVHRDMHYRFRQAKNIGHEINDIAFKHVAHLEDGTVSKSNTLKLTVFNPLPFSHTKEVDAEIWMPADYSCRFDEMIPSEMVNQFHIVDKDGQNIPYQIKHIQKNTTVRLPRAFYGETKDCYHVAFTADLPALGYAEYKIVPSEKPVRFLNSLRTADYTAENEFLILEIKPDGTVKLTDKQNNHVYDDLLHYKDNGETGDGWYSRSPVPDRRILSSAASSIECTSDGPCECTFRITHVMHIPERTVYNRRYTLRAENTQPLIIKTSLTLQKNATCLKCTTEVNNNCRDHRMLLSLKTGIASSTYTADQAFTFIERPAGFDTATHDWKEADREGKNFANIVYRKRPDGSGLAFLSVGGMHEAGALKQDDGQLDICLFRTFEKTFLTDGQNDGELLDTLTFHYGILPFGKEMTHSNLSRAKDILQVPAHTYTVPVSEDYLPKISPDHFALTKNLAYISLIEPGRKGEGRIAVRLVNYSDETVSDTLVCPASITDACETDFLQDPVRRADFHENTLSVTLEPHKIQTYVLKF